MYDVEKCFRCVKCKEPISVWLLDRLYDELKLELYNLWAYSFFISAFPEIVENKDSSKSLLVVNSNPSGRFK